MRTFIALDIPETNQLNQLYTDLKTNITGLNIRFTEIQNLHLTLAFLGEINKNLISYIIQQLTLIKGQHLEFTIELKGVGKFGNKVNPQIIWVGIVPNESLTKLWHSITISLQLPDFQPDPRGFSPHLTIGRIKSTKSTHNLEDFLIKYHEFNFGTIRISKFVLYESILKQIGPQYKPIEIFNLG